MRLLISSVLLALATPAISQDKDEWWQDAPIIPPPPGYQLVQLSQPWDFVDIGDWEYQGHGDEWLMFTRPARQSNQVWVRYEWLPELSRSERSLVEVDCATWRTRKVQIDAFFQSNLQGAPEALPVPQPWSFAAPDTVADLTAEVVCEG